MPSASQPQASKCSCQGRRLAEGGPGPFPLGRGSAGSLRASDGLGAGRRLLAWTLWQTGAPGKARCEASGSVPARTAGPGAGKLGPGPCGWSTGWLRARRLPHWCLPFAVCSRGAALPHPRSPLQIYRSRTFLSWENTWAWPQVDTRQPRSRRHYARCHGGVATGASVCPSLWGADIPQWVYCPHEARKGRGEQMS